MQFNGGKDERYKEYVLPEGMLEPITSEYLDFDEVWAKYDKNVRLVSRNLC